MKNSSLSLLILIASIAISAVLDMYFEVSLSYLYWLIGCITGVFAMLVIIKDVEIGRTKSDKFGGFFITWTKK